MTFEIFPVFRGLSDRLAVNSPFIGQTRKDRRPRDMPFETHQRADNWFLNSFGVRYRSQALFVTGNRFVASQYACSQHHVVRIIPLGKYSICWSRIYSDLFSYRNHAQNLTIEEYLSNGDYREGYIEEAVASGNEIMLFCDQYIAIPDHLLELNKSGEVTPSLIIP